MLTETEFRRLLQAAEDSLFPLFWQDLLLVIRETGFGPCGVLVATSADAADKPGWVAERIKRLQGTEWPLVLGESDDRGLLKGLRVLASRAGLEGHETITFNDLCEG